MAASEQLTFGLTPDSPTHDVDTDDLPDGWTTRAFGDLVTVMGGGTPSKGNPAYWDGSIPWVSPKDMKSFELFDSQDHITEQAVAESPVKRIAPNSVLVVFRSGILAHTLPIAINRVPVTLNQDMKALTPRGEVSCDYLAYYLRSAQRDILEAAKKKGATVESIDADAFLRTPVPFPAFPEQRRIVGRIEELAAKIEQARGLRREAMQEVGAIMPKALAVMHDELLISEYPKVQLGQIAQVTSGGTPSRDIADYWGGNISWVKTGELLDGDICETEEFITQQGLDNSSAKLFPPETVLIALYGQGQTRGRTGRLMIEATTNQACCAILPVPSRLDSRFVQYLDAQPLYRNAAAIPRRHATQFEWSNDQGHRDSLATTY